MLIHLVDLGVICSAALVLVGCRIRGTLGMLIIFVRGMFVAASLCASEPERDWVWTFLRCTSMTVLAFMSCFFVSPPLVSFLLLPVLRMKMSPVWAKSYVSASEMPAPWSKTRLWPSCQPRWPPAVSSFLDS